MSNVVLFPGQADPDTIALNFFVKVLPESGLYCAAIKKRGGGFNHYFSESIEALWERIKQEDRDGHTAYFAVATFSSNERTIEAVAEKQALSLDIDYGQGHSRPGYATLDEAKNALKAFCLHVGLPVPIIIMSGGGLHAHWPFKTVKTRVEWQPYADGLKAACIEFGLRADHSLTANAAAIFRPPGTLNRKLGTPRAVETDEEWVGVGPYDWPEQLVHSVQRRVPVPNDLPPRPIWLPTYAPNLDAFPSRYPLANATALADNCGQYGRFRATGVLPEPVWNHLAAGMPFVEDGERVFHEWSSTDPRYKREETQYKYDRAKRLTGPPGCKPFEELDPETRAICLACPVHGVVKTPFQIGEKSEREKVPDSVGVVVERTSPRKAAFVEWEKTEKGAIKPGSYKNTAIAIGRLGLTCRHDVFHLKKFVKGEGVGPILNGEACRAVRERIITQFKFDPKKENIWEALERECERNPFDPVKDYLTGLQWDGRPRIDTWLSSYVGAVDTPLSRAFGRKVLLAAVRRVRNPGCKFDYLLVFEGPQGVGKSSAWRVLAGDENFSDQPIKWDNPKQQREAAGGVWIHEMAELVGLRKADVESIKSFLSRQNDRERAAYEHLPDDQPRRCIFVGTVNPIGRYAEYLTDPTGARRFWPVRTGRIDLEALARDRDQLWAEAAHYEAKAEPLALPEGLYDAVRDEQDLRRVADPWFDILSGVGGNQVATIDLMLRDLGLDKGRLTPQDASRVAAIMRRLGWDGPKMLWMDGRSVKGYER